MQYVLIAIVVVGFAVAIIRIQVRQNRVRPAREAIERETVLFKGRVAVKVMLPSGWSRKTLGGMQLIVRTEAIQVLLVHSSLGAFIGSEWHLN